MLGVNPDAIRHPEDFYATDPLALSMLLLQLCADGVTLNPCVWEPACGTGNLVKVLKTFEYDVYSTDLVDRGYGQGGVDFLQQKDIWRGDILTNPPFKLAEEFVEKGMSLLLEGNKLILFLKIQFLEGQKRKLLFEKYPPKYVYCHSSRQRCCLNGEMDKYTQPTQFYAWYIWEKGYKGDTILRWI